MTRNPDAAQYDFRSPSRLAAGVEQHFAEWQQEFCKILSERLNQHLPFAVTFRFETVNPQSTRKLLGTMSEETAAFQFKLGPESLPCLFTFSRRFMLLLVNGMLGEIAGDLPQDRGFSHVEQALSEIVAEEITIAASEAFVTEEPLQIEFTGCDERPQRTRLFPRDSIIIVSVVNADVNKGGQACQFVIPYSVADLFPAGAAAAAVDTNQTRERLESIVKAVPVTLEVPLGSAELKFSELANLQVGDVIVLDQSATTPLLASIDGQPRFQVWPGKVGKRGACQIAGDA